LTQHEEEESTQDIGARNVDPWVYQYVKDNVLPYRWPRPVNVPKQGYSDDEPQDGGKSFAQLTGDEEKKDEKKEQKKLPDPEKVQFLFPTEYKESADSNQPGPRTTWYNKKAGVWMSSEPMELAQVSDDAEEEGPKKKGDKKKKSASKGKKGKKSKSKGKKSASKGKKGARKASKKSAKKAVAGDGWDANGAPEKHSVITTPFARTHTTFYGQQAAQLADFEEEERARRANKPRKGSKGKGRKARKGSRKPARKGSRKSAPKAAAPVDVLSVNGPPEKIQHQSQGGWRTYYNTQASPFKKLRTTFYGQMDNELLQDRPAEKVEGPLEEGYWRTQADNNPNFMRTTWYNKEAGVWMQN